MSWPRGGRSRSSWKDSSRRRWPLAESGRRSRSATRTIAATRDCRSSRYCYSWQPDVPPFSLVKELPLGLRSHFSAPVHWGTQELRTRPETRSRATYRQGWPPFGRPEDGLDNWPGRYTGTTGFRKPNASLFWSGV